mmetsp:Transcript_16998/g.23776  ORF Transcript_16998/g.23776 Transcript_16998/m.23776 type:complete len:434 (+) Transcript_16998:201-1502(+)|eukprot:CAMPEP_0184481604 /NCGR_PEP_ID=MMETSP0113_2-20130426/3157_1 /TAXON_ID=91329 /ORGANISM="Norrisiella sphaerica, Strain BC52" /LENGTH=433 /DNA_ID=CAMNT_0026860823 /DNA_START=137 /DNA_END=1438 /DNA_ORIENTATION=+
MRTLLPQIIVCTTLMVVSMGAYDPNQDYESLMKTFDEYPDSHHGKLGELTLYEIQDFADTIADPDARARVEQFAYSMEMMLKMMEKNPATTKLKDLRRMATRRKESQQKELSDEELERQLKDIIDPEENTVAEQIKQMKPLMKALGLKDDDLTEEKIKELMSPEYLHKVSQQVLGNLGVGGAGTDGLLESLLGLDGLGEEEDGSGEFVYQEWLEGLSEKDQKALNTFLQGEIPETLDELKQIPKSELASSMSPLTANRIWRQIHLGKRKKKKRSGLSGPLGALTGELQEIMDVVEKNPNMKQYSERFLDAITKGDYSHEDILALTKEMQEDPHVKKLTEKLKAKAGPGPDVGHMREMLDNVDENEFKTMLETMAGLGLPGFDGDMKERLAGVDMRELKEEYGVMMEALLSGKDISQLQLPVIDKLMGKVHDDL